ncbi:RHS repeat-associated core domain-containing protein [Nesterenkonia rhizosphaerae]|uniref:RHS repeat-associated protein n=1 Tax=Nesterenkonia rhizosphaerae TaxID=1348272 RepID=A0ABP9G0H3_9MICC
MPTQRMNRSIAAKVTGVVITSALLLGGLTPGAQASTHQQPPAESESGITTADDGSSEPRTVIREGGRKPLEFRPELPVLNPGACVSQRVPWALLTDHKGLQHWAEFDSRQPTRAHFPDFEMTYPGGDITLTLFEKEADPDYCFDDYPPHPSELTEISTEHIRVEWEKPEIIDVSYTDAGGNQPVPVVTASPGWKDFHRSEELGGMSFFTVRDLGTEYEDITWRRGRCTPITGQPHKCTLNVSIPNDEVLMLTALPEDDWYEDSYGWIVQNSLSTYFWADDFGGSRDLPSLTKAGPTKSARCNRICTGDPIDTFTGTFFENQTDLSVPGRIGIDVTRHYSVGTLDATGALGKGWSLNYDMHIDMDYRWDQMAVVEPNGNITPFDAWDYEPMSPTIQADLVETSRGWEFRRWNERHTYIFNTSGRLTAIRDENSNEVTLTYRNGRVSRVTEGPRHVDFAWQNNLLRSVTDHTGRTVTYDYTRGNQLQTRTTPDGRKSHYQYDGAGRVTEMTFEDGSTATNVYDAQNRITKQTLPSGQVIELNYGRATNNGCRVVNTETSGSVVKTYTYIDGRISEFTNSANPEENFKRIYNRLGAPIIEESFNGQPQRRLNTYDEAGNLIRTEEAHTGAVETFEYNRQRKITLHQDPAWVRTRTAYDSRGNIRQITVTPTDRAAARISRFTHNQHGDVLTATNPRGGTETMTYTAAGDLLSISTGSGEQTTLSYDTLGRVTSESHPDGASTQYTYDQAGNVTEVTDHTGTTRYEYDPLGQPVSITDPRGKTKTAEYDGAGNQVRVTEPDGSVERFTYDSATGNRTSWTDPRGLTTNYRHQPWRVTTIGPDGVESTTEQVVQGSTVQTRVINDDYPDGAVVSTTDGRTSTTFAAGDGHATNQVTRNTAGQVTTETLPDGSTVTFRYNGFGELISQTGQDRSIGYEYDSLGNITRITYPDGTSVTRTFDENGRLSRITDWNGDTYTYGYNEAGQNTTMASSSGVGYRQDFDGPQITSKTWTHGSQVLGSFQNTYTDGGLLSSQTKHDKVRDYAWDDRGWLAEAGNEPVHWEGRTLAAFDGKTLIHDAFGRLAGLTHNGATTEYAYDSQGNRTAAGTDTYGWNAVGQLTSFNDTSYSYGAIGIRTAVGDNAQVYDQGLKLLSDGATKYLWGPSGELLDQAELGDGKSTQQAITDTMGTVYSVVAGGQVIAEYDYGTFGERELVSGTDATSIGYTSEQHDDSGLIYLRYRYYDPTAGQFISVDPLVAATLDPYGYASGNPLQMLDPLGLFSLGEVGDWVWENSGNISAGLSLAAFALASTGVGAPVGMVLGAGAVGFGGLSAARSVSEGNYVDAALDLVGFGLGAGAIRATMRVPTARQQVINSGAPYTRRDIRNAEDRFRKKAFSYEVGGLSLLSTHLGC